MFTVPIGGFSLLAVEAAVGKTLNYVSDGDVNGLLYWLGTNEGVSAWVNPQSNSKIVVTSTTLSFGSMLNISDRTTTRIGTDNATNAFVQIEIVGAKKLNCNFYSIRTQISNSEHLRSWRLEGSNDNLSWVVLDTQTNNTTLNSESAWVSLPATSTTHYKYFKVIQTALNSTGFSSLWLGELELYGNFN